MSLRISILFVIAVSTYVFTASAGAVHSGAQITISDAAGSTPSKESTDCQYAGIRYVGRTAQGGKVCFTLTPNGKVMREFAFTYPDKPGCRGDVAGFRVTSGEEGLDLVTDGRVDLTDPEFKLRASIRGAGASGVFSHTRGACGPGEVTWTAHRVGAGPTASPPRPSATKAGRAIRGSYAGTAAGGQRISFRVSGDGQRVYALTVDYDPADCRGTGAATSFVPGRGASIGIARDGTFSADNGIPGIRFGTKISGRFQGSGARGTLHVVDEKCDSGTVGWSARRIG